MEDSEKVNMVINIGTQPVKLEIPFERQEFVRDVEDEIRVLFSKWRRSYPTRDERELLAMMVYQYASYYSDLKTLQNKALMLANDCLADMDNMDP